MKCASTCGFLLFVAVIACGGAKRAGNKDGAQCPGANALAAADPALPFLVSVERMSDGDGAPQPSLPSSPTSAAPRPIVPGRDTSGPIGWRPIVTAESIVVPAFAGDRFALRVRLTQIRDRTQFLAEARADSDEATPLALPTLSEMGGIEGGGGSAPIVFPRQCADAPVLTLPSEKKVLRVQIRTALRGVTLDQTIGIRFDIRPASVRPRPTPMLEVPLMVFRLVGTGSSTAPARDAGTLRALVEGPPTPSIPITVNDVFGQAGIRFRVCDVRDAAVSDAAAEKLPCDLGPDPRDPTRTVCLRTTRNQILVDHAAAMVANAYVVREIEGASELTSFGRTVPAPGKVKGGSFVSEKPEFTRPADTARWSFLRTFAHALGHFLELGHGSVGNRDTRRLMQNTGVAEKGEPAGLYLLDDDGEDDGQDDIRVVRDAIEGTFLENGSCP